jgi:hypothetical protein
MFSQGIVLLEDIKTRFSKYAGEWLLLRKNKEGGRIINGRQTTCKWIDNQQSYKRENKTTCMDISERSLSALFSDLFSSVASLVAKVDCNISSGRHGPDED